MIDRSIVTVCTIPSLYTCTSVYYCVKMGSKLNLRKWVFTSGRPTETYLEIQCMLNLLLYEGIEYRQTNGNSCCLKYNVCITCYYINEFKICRSTVNVVVPCLGYNTYTFVCVCVYVTV